MAQAPTLEAVLSELGDLPGNIIPLLADSYAQGDNYEYYATDGDTWDWYSDLDDALGAYSEGTLIIYPPDPEPGCTFYDDEYGLTVAERNGV